MQRITINIAMHHPDFVSAKGNQSAYNHIECHDYVPCPPTFRISNELLHPLHRIAQLVVRAVHVGFQVSQHSDQEISMR